MSQVFPEEKQQERYFAIVQKVMGKHLKTLAIRDLFIHENLELKRCEIRCLLQHDHKSATVTGIGVELVDTLFDTLMMHFSNDYVSLKNIVYVDFSIHAKLCNKIKQSQLGSSVEIVLALYNGKNNLYFRKQGGTLNVAATQVVCSAVEYLINSEMAVKMIYKDIQDAKARNRCDLIQRGTSYLAELVHITSYEDVLSRKGEENNV